ncbi:lactate 2-monooxygenase [Pimelobacter simplex]|uniref:Lactate 2-monooxygenase n=1 Tax=Nocardioides simplex TaxID=2045 RepID=A0A0A1DM31_NOCSI|nr:alpha-hydroxy-acid oxidizing protein [Pimelobacter simplex]AIY17692.1 Lactate 2-monooxygenase [Pimelobacter simplex]MCG8150132.1 lactate 2-monooxygenase [Pimelobacter simplex]GEB13658.1 lactate 2-monooxygenase [Pimelobacter simplex]SFM70362.1 FMN-dependent dehydrogenase, includes L-lactate dehydrogenase and type II isopentenyl diphosphate isomerase [Pimelobacter simplex]
MSFGDYQLELYLGALGGVLPAHPFDYADLEARALAALPPELRTYVAGGAGDESTQRANVAAFERWAVVPRMLRAPAERDLSVELLGRTLTSPLLLAPVGVIGICTPDQHGDVHAAEVAAATGVPFIGSTLMSDPLEVVSAAAGDAPKWFQLYTPKNRELAESLVRRAEAAGYEAIVVTLDTWVPGWRPRDLASGNFPQLRGKALANYTSDPVFQEMTGPNPDPGTVVMTWAGTFGHPVTWEDLPWLRSLTDLPIVLKGICHPDDARQALDAGVDGIYCSNHGGRQANGGGAALDWLPDVVAAVDGRAPVVFDSGVRSGADVVKAVALGADAVAIGRPYAYALALGGVPGAVHQIRSMLAEADLIMAVDGYPTLADLGPDALRRTS